MTKRTKFVVKGITNEPLSNELIYEKIHNILTGAKMELSYLIVEDERG